MEIKLEFDELRKRKLFLGLPCYGGQCAALYARSVADLAAVCSQIGIPLQMYFLMNESLITRARNYVCDEFLRSEADHLMFIDSDIGFNAKDVIAMLALQSQESNYDVLGGCYPKKCIAFEKIKVAVDKGFADENPQNLERFIGDYVFNPKNGMKSIPIGEPAEVLETGTGFMMIKRNTLLKYKEAYPEKSYKPDHIRTAEFDGSREIHMFFNADIDKETKRYLSEDYLFCQEVQKIKMKVWICPWIQLQHVGTYTFGGSLADLAALGVTATASPDELKKKPKEQVIAKN